VIWPRQAAIVALVAGLLAAAIVLPACGEGGKPVADNRGAQLFSDRCAGCHTLKAAGAEGTISGQRPTGPNLDKRKLTRDEALFAIRNGGFSGAIMPQNIVVGEDAEAVAEFLERYAGSETKAPASPRNGGGATGGGGSQGE
jgi:mono/diheme cytochrome c family protein